MVILVVMVVRRRSSSSSRSRSRSSRSIPGEAPAGQTGKDGEKRNGKRIDGKDRKRRWRG